MDVVEGDQVEDNQVDDIQVEIIFVGGPSGVGKTRFSSQLAKRLQVSIIETDDLFNAVIRETKVETHPELHFFVSNAESKTLSAEATLKHFLILCEAFEPRLRSVIDRRLESGARVIVEGDHILPAFAASYSNRVASVFLYEPDHKQIVNNYLAREPESGTQTKRAKVSLLHGDWLKNQCEQFGLSAIPVRPWRNQVDRALEAMNG